MKNRTKKSLIIILSALCLQFPSVFAQKYTPEVRRRIEQVETNLAGSVQIEGVPNWTLEERMNFYNVNGVSIAVIKDYKIDWAKGYGWADIESKRKVTTKTIFQAGEISQSLNAVGILSLAQEGKINLSADINNYLKSWKFPYNDSTSNGRKISTINLLSHSSSIMPTYFSGYSNRLPIPTLDQILRSEKPAANTKFEAVGPPTKLMTYSSGGVLISQKIIEDISGLSYEDYMQKNILKPLGMYNSTFDQSLITFKEKDIATGYYDDGKEVRGKYRIYPQQAIMGLWTTPIDLCKFLIETQLAYIGESSKVLTMESVKTQLQSYASNAALGTFIQQTGDSRYIDMWGHPEGFNSMYYAFMENGDGLVVMTNTKMFHSFLREVTNSVAQVYNWRGYYNPMVRQVEQVSNEILKKYIGKYSANYEYFTVMKKENKYWIKIYNEFHEIHFSSENEFFVIEPETEGRFYKNEKGEIAGLEIKRGASYKKVLKVF
ncbi:MAG: beta-lactamase family protein [Pyrinomonadaceae bacterium]|nr:beta-lactamase family protein [Sphingobacteriaceae bacterium]